ncbi:MAG: adenine phosphoribosyltransferase [Opitutaceae bacterium]|nr:adenine phosphoribosyltransferase [Cytophagales bacterium]
MLSEKIKENIRDIQDFPKRGILFKDITPIFELPDLCTEILEGFIEALSNSKIDAVACIESRGFFFGMLLAQKLRVPFIPIRKKGKLPYKTLSLDYELEYGTETMEMHVDAIKPGQNVLIHDDVLATGGTALAASQLIMKAGGNIAGYAFLLSVGFLEGDKKLQFISQNIITLAEY